MKYKEITSIELEGINPNDYPDFCDAYIVRAMYKGREMTEYELEEINEDSDFVHQCVFDYLY